MAECDLILRGGRVIDPETGAVESMIVKVDPPPDQSTSNKRPHPASPRGQMAQLIDMSARNVKVKREAAEARHEASEAMERLEARVEDQLNCVVCLERPRTVVLRPCCHYVCCATCARAQERCPATGCQTPITSRMQNVCSVPHMQDVEVTTGVA